LIKVAGGSIRVSWSCAFAIYVDLAVSAKFTPPQNVDIEDKKFPQNGISDDDGTK
jgi:hypothetical protein